PVYWPPLHTSSILQNKLKASKNKARKHTTPLPPFRQWREAYPTFPNCSEKRSASPLSLLDCGKKR
ncbi:MAG: hypothetical protein NZM04_00775, partial [Methylacidiphilales bacterium]|nr:hypothetical protein [Candidatus Methylacidiphilales bacterium]